MRRGPLELHGHRGARGLWPENSWPAIEGALALGVSFVEVDIALTRDGVAVLSHDPILDPDLTRGPDGGWIAPPGDLIRDLTAAELAAYDIGRMRPGSANAALFPRQAGADGIRLPSLADVLAQAPEARFAIELKTFPDHPGWTVPPDEMADAVLAVVEEAEAFARCRFISFDWRALRHLAKRRPELSLGFLTDGETLAAARLWWGGMAPVDFGGSVPRTVAAAGGRIWGPDHTTLTLAEIAEAEALGLLINPWTVNDPADIARLIDWGVGALTTDYPDIARAVMAGKGIGCA
ncbi:glycerophosphodiester phosphodiesterase family protein [Acidisoma sp. C75]